MRRRVHRFLLPSLAAVAALALAIACGEGGVTIPDAELPDTGVKPPSDDASTVDTGTDVVDAASPADVVCPEVLTDEATGIHVSTTGTNGASCGTRAAPCKTVGTGITRALAAKPERAKVYVARGTYAEKVTLAADIEIIGGWDVAGTTWRRTCVAPEEAVILRAPAASNVTVEAKNLGGEARLSTLTVQSKPTAQVDPGESLYGVIATGATTSLVMNDVRVAVGSAGDGAGGTKGAPGANGAAICLAGAGTAGTAGTQGPGAGPGAFDPAGYSAAPGAAGGPATPGADGTPGAAGTCVVCGTCGVLCEFIPAVAPPACGKDGAPGCAGGAGTAGGPAAGGGSSIGVYAWDAVVTIDGGTITSGDAGRGGAGGTGGAGGAGTNGAAGADTEPCTTACTLNAALACVETKSKGLGGVAGGAGGGGGLGGTGGGGSGGSSFAIYQGGAGVVTTTGGATLAHGKAGPGGGPAGAGAGAAGAAADRVP